MTNLVPDINLKRVINKYFSRSSDSHISKFDLERIDDVVYCDVSFPGYYISNLNGLQYAINLKNISIEDQLITNIHPISNLTNIKSLFFNNNYITNVPDLSKMTNLSSLHLNHNHIKDVYGLTTAKKIETLKICNNNISDLTPLSILKNLKDLQATNQVVNIKDVYTSIESYSLDISFLKDINGDVPSNIEPSHSGIYNPLNNEISWSDIRDYNTKLNFVFYNKEKNFTGIVIIELIGLNEVVTVEDENFKAELSNLLSLDSSIITKKDLLKLRFLDMDNKNIESLKGIEYAENLYTLKADKNKITDLKHVPTSVNYLSLKNQHIVFNCLLKNPRVFSHSLEYLQDKKGHFISHITPALNGYYNSETNNITWDIDYLPQNLEFYFSSYNNYFTGTVILQLQSENSDFKESKELVAIPDINLRIKINKAINRYENHVISYNDLNTLTVLDCYSKSIKNLEGLQYCQNINILSLVNNDIQNINYLSQLTTLNYLDLSRNHIYDISALNHIQSKIKYLHAHSQVINFEEYIYNEDCFTFSLDFLKDFNGENIKNIIPSSEGTYIKENNNIVWNLESQPSFVSISFINDNHFFSGVIYISFIYKVQN